MQFKIQQLINVWQEFKIEADSVEQAIEMVSKEPSCSNYDNNGITVLNETEDVLTTELYDEGNEDGTPLFTWHKDSQLKNPEFRIF